MAKVKITRMKRSPLQKWCKQFDGGVEGVMGLLAVSGDPVGEELARRWRSAQSLRDVDGDQKTIEGVLEAAGITPKQLVQLYSGAAYELHIMAGNAIAFEAYPAIMRASVKRAKENDATTERKMHFEASRFVPTKAGVNIAIQQNNQKVEDDDEPLPGRPVSFDRRARSVVRELPPKA